MTTSLISELTGTENAQSRRPLPGQAAKVCAPYWLPLASRSATRATFWCA
jgi:hypothetical protein